MCVTTFFGRKINLSKLLIFTATYNEVDNIEKWYRRTRNAAHESWILIVDDNSTDGTRERIENIAVGDKRVMLISRPRKLGLGTAHKFAFEYALSNEFTHLITLDADLSHEPEAVVKFMAVANNFDFVIGTRSGLGSSDYTGIRKILSFLGNKMAQILIPTGLSEYTTSFRLYNRNALEEILKNPPGDDGYAFFMEIVDLVYNLGLKFSEVPIHFKSRYSGTSKIPKHQIFKSVIVLLKLSTKRVYKRLPSQL